MRKQYLYIKETMIRLKHILTEQSMLDKIIGAIGSDPRAGIDLGIPYRTIEGLVNPADILRIILRFTDNLLGTQEAAVEAAFIAMSRKKGLYTRVNNMWMKSPKNGKGQSLLQFVSARMDLSTKWHKQSIRDMQRKKLLS